VYFVIDSAQLRVGEGEREKEDTTSLLRKQKESLNHQLEMVKKCYRIKKQAIFSI
jgi:hypothetical protein